MGSDPQSSPPARNDRERQEAADERDRLADARERAADERERRADQRETTADRREEAADDRERHVAAWEIAVDDRERAVGHAPPSRRQRSYEQIERIQKLLTASQDRIDRSESALRRADAADVREQGTVDREAAASAERRTTAGPTRRDDLRARVRRLQQQSAMALDALSAAQDRLAHDHEEHGRLQRAAEHRREAELARETAEALRAAQETDDGQTTG
ncbi:hypothetical protein [Streptomyces venezuelae]|uniref:hypothetical protein n=1 Tax=Streptomyces venezuelae TaxID=54571 RepID=UPI00378BCF0B